MPYSGSPERALQKRREYAAANRERRREHYAANRERFNARERERRTNPDCRERRKQQYREWYEANREQEKQRCRDYNAANRDLRNQRNRERLADPEYRERRDAQNREWRAANRERRKQQSREWREANRARYRELINRGGHKRRALLNEAQVIPFTTEQWAAKVAYWGDRCWVCGEDWSAMDHVKPIAAGGAHALCNLRPICKSCNSSKRHKWPLVDVLGWPSARASRQISA